MTEVERARRITQRDIARLAGVSQTTVSLVLNNRADDTARIPVQTRDRVLRVIRETGYVADPIARRLAERRNRILGVFTYEPMFPSSTADFYHPFLVGIEECAERLGCDLLLFTSAPAVGGRRRIYQDGNRLRLADGCILLGRQLDRGDLSRLVSEGQPFVSVGRRDDAGGPVPYVAADYAAAVGELVRRAVAAGHQRLAYLGEGAGPESYVDRMTGFTEAVAAAGVAGQRQPVGGRPAAEVLDALLAAGVTAVFLEEYADGVALADAARLRGVPVPGALSLVAMGHPTRSADTDLAFTGFRIPRQEMGWRAVELLTDLVEGGADPGARQQLLPCELVDGATLAPPAGA
ncbi:LacI family DNA-binding transcriptional regulator [Natronosporangium hydrolyticum]|uniref:LacI family DNA-binding transcriptional regulator n=1 Tax=Natronosporangium hydrolyticum TaxID=2811111 RepID=A0A895YRG6_9ACTN|nr:LacI family DNA-binding transcriptional regulator [Natronosporangium hydrolyticum]QSB16710.1 LacI family DNA-binding transcriptional regulator [Natronosporangium hydrolyticum]